jgi:protein-L-isoaspartate(D-aspartate) O-methyltransferase
MIDFENMRLNMVKGQIAPNKVSHSLILKAFQNVPREEFVPSSLSKLAYAETEVVFEDARFMLEPAAFARLIQAADLHPEDKVLDIGCASGYSSVILSFLARTVIGIDSNPTLIKKAKDLAKKAEAFNAKFFQAALELGYTQEAPYDVIFIEGAVYEVPQNLFDQLKDKGKLVTFVKKEPWTLPAATLFTKNGTTLTKTPLFETAASLIFSESSLEKGFRL